MQAKQIFDYLKLMICETLALKCLNGDWQYGAVVISTDLWSVEIYLDLSSPSSNLLQSLSRFEVVDELINI